MSYNTPIVSGVCLQKFTGNERVVGVHYMDRQGKAHEISYDAVAYGYGLKRETQLAELAGAEFTFDEQIRQWHPRIDTYGRLMKIFGAVDGIVIGGVDAAAALSMLLSRWDSN